MHEQRQKKNDRKRDTDQPKQSASTKAHDGLHSLCCVINSAVIHKFRIRVRQDELAMVQFGGLNRALRCGRAFFSRAQSVVVGVWWGPRFTRPLLGPFDDTVLPDYRKAPSLWPLSGEDH
jgi:hypothetical protein